MKLITENTIIKKGDRIFCLGENKEFIVDSFGNEDIYEGKITAHLKDPNDRTDTIISISLKDMINLEYRHSGS